MSASVVLQSWKEISAYVGRTERTLQRWETRFGFPVHRPSSKSRSAVMALSHEIHEWTRGKPSLVLIQGGSNLGSATSQAPRSGHISKTCISPPSPSAGLPNEPRQFVTAKLLENSMREQLQVSRSLWEEQRNLRADILDLLRTQRKLREELRQNLLRVESRTNPVVMPR